MVVKTDLLVGSEVAVRTLVLLLEQVVRMVLHVALEKAPRAKLLSTYIARVDGQRHTIGSDNDSWGDALKR